MLKQAPAKTFEELIVWQKSHQWTLLVYRITAAYPRQELYGLVSQMRRFRSFVSHGVEPDLLYLLLRLGSS